jgi:hypothetical protein
MKRQGVFPQQPVELVDVPEDDDDDDDVEEIDVSKSTAEKVAVKPKAPAPAPSASAAAKSTDSSKTSTSKSNMPKLDADDGVGRMKHAAYFYETQQFSKAEVRPYVCIYVCMYLTPTMSVCTSARMPLCQYVSMSVCTLRSSL